MPSAGIHTPQFPQFAPISNPVKCRVNSKARKAMITHALTKLVSCAAFCIGCEVRILSSSLTVD
ncbi:Uncharacterised protein [Vibrio cholerae]|nr:Uncharacterised protein [Vibrio cholerae]